MQVSKVCNIQFNQQNQTQFKSAMPVIIKVGEDIASAVPVIGFKPNETFMRKSEYMLNNTLKRGINEERDKMVDRFRKYMANWVSDFKGRVAAFTCVDGGFQDGEMKPYFYFLTGDTIGELEKLRHEHKDAVAASQGYKTANLKIAKDNYYNRGKSLVQKAFERFRPYGKEPQALFVYFKPVRTKSGTISDYKLNYAEFKSLNDYKKPSIHLDKINESR